MSHGSKQQPGRNRIYAPAMPAVSIRAGWLGLGDRIEECLGILLDVGVGEARLADAGVDDALLFDAELDLAALGVLDRLRDVGRDRAELRVRHQALWTQHLAEPADDTHHVGRRDDAAVIEVAILHGFHQVLGTDDVGTGGLGLVGLVAAREDGNLDVLAGARRQRDDAADHLVGVARIDAEVHRDLDRLVELLRSMFLERLDRLGDVIELLGIELGDDLLLLG
jgi:hypothetical protein